eukprot:3810708-Pleurochrysis_carterae.AAC.1
MYFLFHEAFDGGGGKKKISAAIPLLIREAGAGSKHAAPIQRTLITQFVSAAQRPPLLMPTLSPTAEVPQSIQSRRLTPLLPPRLSFNNRPRLHSLPPPPTTVLVAHRCLLLPPTPSLPSTDHVTAAKKGLSMLSRAMRFAPRPFGEEGRRVALDMLRMHHLGQPLPPCRFGSSDHPPLVGYTTSTCKELNEQRYHTSNSFNLYVDALLPKMHRPIHTNN